MENIKAKVNIYVSGQVKPIASAEDFDTLKRLFSIKNSSEDETLITELIDSETGRAHKVVDVKLRIYKETMDMHGIGVDFALQETGGIEMDHNIVIQVYIEK